MRSLKTIFVLLALIFVAPVLPARPGDGDKKPGGERAVSPPTGASKEEVEQLRREVADLKAVVLQLVEANQRLVEAGQRTPRGPRLITTSAPQPEAPPAELAPAPAPEPDPGLDLNGSGYLALQAKKEGAVTMGAGWNGEHFFIKSSDGKFQLQPYGYVQTDFRSFSGDGAPPNGFSVRRGRFGFQGNYGSHFQYGMLTDGAAGSGAIIRDIYLNVKVNNEFQFQAGQFKESFAQELAAGITNVDFVERGLQALLYPSASSAYRSPGVTVHGDISGGVFQYWVGAFNGKGFNVTATTSEPEVVARVRLYPWRKQKDSVFQGLAFGGSYAHSRTRGLSNELTLNSTMPDAAYTFFPQFRVNGGVQRYEGEFTYLKGPFATRGEYVQALYSRDAVGPLQLGGLGFADLPGVRFKAWNIAATYLLTGEKRPENGTPRVKHSMFGPETPGGGDSGWGAWEVAVRYSGIQGKEPGAFFNNVFTPQNVPGFDRHTDEFTFGLNWYPNYWVRFQTNVSFDRLKQPSTIGVVPQNYFVYEQRLQFRF